MRRAESSPALWLVLVVFVLLQLPFASTPFRVDEPNLLAIARQISEAPLDPYGFEINWLGTSQPAWEVLRNPPLVPYWTAAWAALFGWSETSLHLGMLPWALLALLGAGGLGQRTGMPPWLGAALLGSSIAFFVSAPLLMPDVVALALSISAVLLALREERLSMVIAVAAAAAAPLAKYTAIALIAPLVVIAWRRRSGGALAAAAAPVVSLLIWSGVSSAAYGSSHLLASAEAQGGLKLPVVAVLVALGLAVLPPALIALTAARRIAAASFVSGVVAFPVLRFLTENSLGSSAVAAVGVALAVFIISGGTKLLIAEPSTDRIAALAWLTAIVGLAFTYQFVTSRYLLAAAPAAILLAGRPAHARLTGVIAAATVILSISVAWADARHASIYPRVAASMVESPGRRVWLAGHWGFQYYGESGGGVMLEIGGDQRVEEGDLIVLSEATFPEVTEHELMDRYRARRLSRVSFGDEFPLRTQACGPTVSFHGAGASSCENAYRVAIPWGFSSEPLDVVHRLRAGAVSGHEESRE